MDLHVDDPLLTTTDSHGRLGSSGTKDASPLAMTSLVFLSKTRAPQSFHLFKSALDVAADQPLIVEHHAQATAPKPS